MTFTTDLVIAIIIVGVIVALAVRPGTVLLRLRMRYSLPLVAISCFGLAALVLINLAGSSAILQTVGEGLNAVYILFMFYFVFVRKQSTTEDIEAPTASF